MNFFPFPFLQEEAPSVVPPGEEMNALSFSAEIEKRNEQYYLIPAAENSHNHSHGLPEGSSYTGANAFNGKIGPSSDEINNFDTERVNDEVTEGTRNLWSPQVKPWVLEDLENHEKSVLWNVKISTGEIKTVGITFIVNEDDEIVWTNEETFRNNFARLIAQNEVSVRTMYYVVQAFLDTFEDEEKIIQTFSQYDTINMTQPAWFYWRVEKQCVAITPYVEINQFIDKTRTFEQNFEMLHQRLIDKVQHVLEQCDELQQQNDERMQQLVDAIESQATETQAQIEEVTNRAIEHTEEIRAENETLVQECNQQIELYVENIMNTRQQVVTYNQQVNETLSQMQAQAESIISEHKKKINEHELQLAMFSGSMSFMKAGVEMRVNKNKYTMEGALRNMQALTSAVVDQSNDFTRMLQEFSDNAERRMQCTSPVTLDMSPIAEVNTQIAEITHDVLESAGNAITALNDALVDLTRRTSETRDVVARQEQETYNQIIEVANALARSMKVNECNLVRVAEEGKLVCSNATQITQLIANIQNIPIQRRNFQPAIQELYKFAEYTKEQQNRTMAQMTAVSKMKETLVNTLFASQNLFQNTGTVPIVMKGIEYKPSTETNILNSNVDLLNVVRLSECITKTPNVDTSESDAVLAAIQNITKSLEIDSQESIKTTLNITQAPENGKNVKHENAKDSKELKKKKKKKGKHKKKKGTENAIIPPLPEEVMVFTIRSNTENEDPEISEEERQRLRGIIPINHQTQEGNRVQANGNITQQPDEPPQNPEADIQNGTNLELARLKSLLKNVSNKNELLNIIGEIRRSRIFRSCSNQNITEQELLEASVLDVIILRSGKLPDPSYAFLCEDCGMSFSRQGDFGSHCSTAHGLSIPHSRDKGTGIKTLVKCCEYHPQWINNNTNSRIEWIYKCPCSKCTKGEGNRLTTSNGDTLYGHWRNGGSGATEEAQMHKDLYQNITTFTIPWGILLHRLKCNNELKLNELIGFGELRCS